MIDSVSDSQFSLLRGMNSGRSPGLIGNDQAWRLGNVSIRGGRPRSRPRWVRRCALPAGIPQGGTVFQAASEITLAIGGQVLRVNPHSFAIQSFTGTNLENDPTLTEAWFCETEGALVIQDDQSFPFVYDGSSFRRYTQSAGDTLPIGRSMAYGNGRLSVAVGRGRTLRLGDIQDGTAGSELKFTETQFLLGGGDFSFPFPITAQAYLPVIDTQTGNGSLIVASRERTYTLHTEITSRDVWATTNGFRTIMFNDKGITGQHAHASVNQDIYFRSVDGLRSVRSTVADYSGPGSTTLSREMAYRTDYDTEWMLDGCSMVSFDNRLFFTHSPYLLDNIRPIHLGMAALNFDALSESGSKSPPAYDGEWYGPEIVQLFAGEINGERRMFGLCVESGVNSLWEMLPERKFRLDDFSGRYPQDEPEHVVESRVYYGEDPRLLKRLDSVRLWVKDLDGFVDMTVYFRADGTQDWTQLDTFKWKSADSTLASFNPKESRAVVTTREAPDTHDTITGRAVNVGHGFQIKFVWCGDCELSTYDVLTSKVVAGARADNPVEAEDLDTVECRDAMPDAPTAVELTPQYYNAEQTASCGLDELGNQMYGDDSVIAAGTYHADTLAEANALALAAAEAGLSCHWENAEQTCPEGYTGDAIPAGSYTSMVSQTDADSQANAALSCAAAFTQPTLNGNVYDMVLQDDGKLVFVGSFTTVNGDSQPRCARLNTDGSRDTSFNPTVATSTHGWCVLVQADGKILVGGEFTGKIKRFNADGTDDATFSCSITGTGAAGDGPYVRKMRTLASGQLLVVGAWKQVDGVDSPCIAILDPSTGARDASFTSPFFVSGANPLCEQLYDAHEDSSNRIVVSGKATTYDVGLADFRQDCVQRMSSTGTKDATFNPYIGNQVFFNLIQTDGKIIVGAVASIDGVTPPYGYTRINTDGTIDSTFAPALAAYYEDLRGAFQLSTSKLLVGGFFTALNAVARNGLGVVELDGSTTAALPYVAGNTSNTFCAVELGDGSMWISDSFTGVNGSSQNYLAKLNSDFILA